MSEPQEPREGKPGRCLMYSGLLEGMPSRTWANPTYGWRRASDAGTSTPASAAAWPPLVSGGVAQPVSPPTTFSNLLF